MVLDEAIRYYSHLADECRRKANIERYDCTEKAEEAEEDNEQYIFHDCQHDHRWSYRMAIFYRSFGRRIDSVRCRNLACNQQSNWISGGGRQ